MAHGEKKNQSWVEGESSSNEGGRDTKQTFGSKLKRNCGKFWWLYLLIFIIIVVLVVIPILYVAVPKAAQKEINQAEITVDHQYQTAPGPTSFDLVINSTVVSHSSHKGATVEGFNASYYLLNNNPNDTPFVYVPFPPVVVEDVNQVNIAAQHVPVANMDQFIAYNKLVLNSETFQVGIRGNTHVRLNGLPKAPITYDKIVTMKGFNKLAGFKINSIQFHNPPEFDGATLTGKVSIPNPSVISAQFGNVTMNLSANGTFIGTSKLLYVDYRPGNNTYDMRGYIDLSLAIAYTQDYVLNLDIVGNSSVNIAGQHLTYFEEALKSNPIKYSLNITEATSTTST